MEPREDGRLADRDLSGGGGRVSAHTCLFLQPHLYLPPPHPPPRRNMHQTLSRLDAKRKAHRIGPEQEALGYRAIFPHSNSQWRSQVVGKASEGGQRGRVHPAESLPPHQAVPQGPARSPQRTFSGPSRLTAGQGAARRVESLECSFKNKIFFLFLKMYENHYT